MRTCITVLALALPSFGAAQLVPAPTAERCAAAPTTGRTARDWLDRAAATVLPTALDGRVLRFRASQDIPLWEQSDRMYEPFIPHVGITDRWFDPATGVEGRQQIDRPVVFGQYPGQLITPTTIFAGRDTLLRPIAALAATSANGIRRENPWIVLGEWRADAAGARVVQRCMYREQWRIVLERGGDRLYLSESDGTPVKLERIEPHYLWGQVRAEYVWTTWWGVVGGGLYPYATFRIFDGTVYERIGTLSVAGFANGAMALVPRDSAPRLTIPASAQSAPALPAFKRPDTVRVADNTFLLVTPSYTETVAFRRDTVFLLDATTSEGRSRDDSTWIATLFPGKHPVVAVVTDLAWPHISGVRFWVARGATVVSHAGSESFLRRVVDRHWTLEPDALEKEINRPKLRFRAVNDSLRLAGGDLVVHALHGSTTELAVGVWMPKDRYFWAGDYIQGGSDSPYARDVIRTVRDLGLSPTTVGAEHIKLTNWDDLVARVAPARSGDSDPIVFPAGSSGLAFAALTGGVETWQSLAHTPAGDSVQTRAGLQRQEARATAQNGKPAVLLLKSSSANGRMFFADTLLMLRDGFRPIWEHMHYSTTSKVIRYDAGHVHQQTFVGDSLARTLDADYPDPPFGFNQLDLLLCSLPFREGYRAVIPLYSEGDDSVERDTVSVLRLTHGSTPSWRVRFADPAVVLTTVVDTLTRQFISYEAVSRKTGASGSRQRVDSASSGRPPSPRHSVREPRNPPDTT